MSNNINLRFDKSGRLFTKKAGLFEPAFNISTEIK